MAKSPRSKTRVNFSQGKQQKTLTLSQVKRLTEKSPDNVMAWVQLGILLIHANEGEQAREALERACKLDDTSVNAHAWLATAYQGSNEVEAAEHHAKRALALDDTNVQTLTVLARLEHDKGRSGKALEWVEKAEVYAPGNQVVMLAKGRALFALSRVDEAKAVFTALTEKTPDSLHNWNDLGMVHRELGELDEAARCFRNAMQHGSDPVPFANLMTGMHYDPTKTREEIAAVCCEWQSLYGAKNPPSRPISSDVSPGRKLRVGMLSDGFRQHPVGNMIIEVLEHVSPDEVEFYFYTTNHSSDAVTGRFRKLATCWTSVKYLGDDAFAQQVRDDGIDIFFDLAGHNAGTRSRAISMQPAPLIVKWVGGLINTTGIEAIDYLISDHIETPEGEDAHYTEKLIRLPDDYIVYSRPLLVPSLKALPAKKNGYITLGCFNNPTKLNGELFSHWAQIMHQLPNSRLLLKGKPYTSQDFCERIYTQFEQAGIERERLLLEGPAPHHEFLAAYNRVDIALDTWPYSGGLTTCESFLMGVPVVTLPGPTFAGRHSATHLINAGMPELVVDSWEAYHERVLELASDLDSLSTIRQHLRDVLLQSPVCDGPRFAKHLTMALRAIWQRYCEGKAPEALSFNKQGELWFEDDKTPLTISVQEKTKALASAEATEEAFTWQLQGKLIAIDNGGRYLTQPAVQQMLTLKSLELIAFDPAGELNSDAAKNAEGVHYYPNALLGNGEPATLYACLEPAQTATLVPLESAWLPAALRNGNKVLTQLPVNTLPLDKIDGLPTLDWLVLDARHDASEILEHGIEALKETLLIDVGVAFQPTHERQPSLAELQHWASRNGFRFYRLNEPRHRSLLPEHVPAEKRQATELESANALFLPSHERMAKLSDSQRTKLAFLLHTVYGIKDMAYELLAAVDEEKAEGYLVGEGLAPVPNNSANDTETMLRSEHAEKVIPSDSGADNVSDAIDELLGSQAPLASVVTSADEQPLSQDADRILTTPKASKNLWELDDFIYAVDVGANPIDGTPPYSSLLKKGVVKLFGFEPQKDALQKLQTMKGPNETYLPHAVGTGERAKLYLCQASGMTSTLKPNNVVLDHFQGYPIWGKVKSVEEIDTVRLDDVAEIEKIDWLKIDIQGGELNVFQNAQEKLKDALVIQTEVNFIQLYENQPLFAEIDQWMRSHGFMLHTLLEQRKRLYAPMKINGGIHQGINQLTTADAVYVKDINSLQLMPVEQRKKIAIILSKAYGSYDLAYRLLKNDNGFSKQEFFKKIVGKKINSISVD